MAGKFFNTVIDYVLKIREIGADYLIPSLPFLESLAVVLSGILVWGIFYSIAGSGYLNTKIERYLDMAGGPVGKRRQLRAWNKIVAKSKSGKMESWKQAILEADQILDEILKMSGYRGETVHERFSQLKPEAISSAELIIAAHKIRDRIRQELDFVITQREAIEVLKVYQQAFKELGLIS